VKGIELLEKIKLDFQKKEPIYYQIEEQIKFLIASGQILPGEQLPAVREMAEALDVNFNTIARVYRQLDQQGIVSTQHGRGCYVLERPLPDAERKRLMFEELTQTYVLECHALGFNPEDILAYLHQKLSK